jgi:hypothetical protein
MGVRPDLGDDVIDITATGTINLESSLPALTSNA